MSRLRLTALSAVIAGSLLPLALHAAAPAHGHDHGQPGTTASAAAPKPSSPEAGAPDRHQQQLQRMRDLHRKMMAAPTPAERKALLQENLKLMQESMAMMQDMRSNTGKETGEGAMSSSGQGGMGMAMCQDMHKAMKQRMDMRETMLQLLLDQQSVGAQK